MMSKLVLTALLLSAAVGSAAHNGHDHGGSEANKTVIYRQSIFKMMGWHFKTMGKMVQGRAEYDAEDFRRRAKLVHALTQMVAEGFTPSTQDAVTETALKDEMWYQKNRFDGLVKELQEASSELANLPATADKNELRTPLGRVAKTCKQCHDRFRHPL